LPESNLNLVTKPILSSSTLYFQVKKQVTDQKKVEAIEFETLMSALLYPNDYSQTLK